MSRQRFDDSIFDGMTIRDYTKARTETGTFVTNAVTINSWFATLTTESLTTAHTAAATLTITKTGVVAADMAFISLVGGTNTQGVPMWKALCGTNQVVITLQNGAIAANAFNGTFIFNIWIVKAM